MPIATALEPHFRLTYQNNVAMVAQQMKNPLMDLVTRVQGSGEMMSAADFLGASQYQRATERARDNVDNRATAFRRWLTRTAEIEDGCIIDVEDQLDMTQDPTSRLVQYFTASVVRGTMDIITGTTFDASNGIYTVTDGGIYGNAIEGKRGGTTVALPGSQMLAVGGTGMTLDKLRQAKLALNQAEFGMEQDDKLFCLISPKQADDLIAIAAASGTALNAFNIMQLVEGKPTSLMGITWIVSNRVPKDSTGNWLCAVWSKNNIVWGVWEDIQGDVWRDTSKKNKPVVRVWARSDCVRLQDKGVIIIPCIP
jgi:hypothetical protein